ncbi:hypothetical protein SAMN05660477_00701 [Soonwooa buanensis]|uniref:Uncharacterized protein n=1 Tax=Soonwooa buanensis TaxID=619805 RepID=A0A1T5DG05_9FLAO|nr:hypothetical protein SAMN05660477_00701 [Soonwooa buanensis]
MNWDDKFSTLAPMEAASFVGWREAAERSGAVRAPHRKDKADSGSQFSKYHEFFLLLKKEKLQEC